MTTGEAAYGPGSVDGFEIEVRDTTVKQLPIEKLAVIDDHTIVAGTGSIGLDQRFKNVVRKALRERLFAARRGGDDNRTEAVSTTTGKRRILHSWSTTICRGSGLGIVCKSQSGRACAEPASRP